MDKGFDYIPGQTRAKERQRMIEAAIGRLVPEQARWVRQEVSGIDWEFGRPARVPDTREELMAELATRLDVMKNQVLAVGRMQDGKLVCWEGSSKAGWQHIAAISESFENRGVASSELSKFLILAFEKGRVLSLQGTRGIYQLVWNGQVQYVSITVGDNGFIVEGNPTPQRLIRRFANG